MALEQPGGDGSASQATRDDARHGRSDRHAVGRRHPRRGELWREGQRRCRTSGQRRGTDEHTKQWWLAEGTDDGDTHHALQDREKSRQRQKQQRLTTAGTQQ